MMYAQQSLKNRKKIAIEIIDNTSNAITGAFFAGWLGAALSIKTNTTPGMQAILTENGYIYKETKRMPFSKTVMIYENESIPEKKDAEWLDDKTLDLIAKHEGNPEIVDMTDYFKD